MNVIGDKHMFNMNSPYTRSESSSYETFTIAHIVEKDWYRPSLPWDALIGSGSGSY